MVAANPPLFSFVQLFVHGLQEALGSIPGRASTFQNSNYITVYPLTDWQCYSVFHFQIYFLLIRSPFVCNSNKEIIISGREKKHAVMS
jgi:hypothetical protein